MPMTAEAREKALDVLIAKDAIRDVLARYSRGVDRCDRETLLSVYWPDGEDNHGAFNGPAPDFVEFCIPAIKQMRRTMHMTASSLIELETETTARAETYVYTYHELDGPEGLAEMIIGGRYIDTFERRGDEWRVKTRYFVMDWNQNLKSTSEWTKGVFGALTWRGGRFPDDPVYAR